MLIDLLLDLGLPRCLSHKSVLYHISHTNKKIDVFIMFCRYITRISIFLCVIQDNNVRKAFIQTYSIRKQHLLGRSRDISVGRHRLNIASSDSRHRRL